MQVFNRGVSRTELRESEDLLYWQVFTSLEQAIVGNLVTYLALQMSDEPLKILQLGTSTMLCPSHTNAQSSKLLHVAPDANPMLLYTMLCHQIESPTSYASMQVCITRPPLSSSLQTLQIPSCPTYLGSLKKISLAKS